MAFIPSARKKAFLIDRVDGDWTKPEKATLQFEDGYRLRLTMPDKSEWLIEERVLRDLLDAVAESREYYADAKD